MTPAPDVRSIAFFLPQFHPIPENDEWWGTGFTEWRLVAQARPLFRGHLQPDLPADLGFYDLRLSDVRVAQAELARRYRIHGFCYYHYWFHGRRLLERPFSEVLARGEPSLPFCLCWANEPWTRAWDGRDEQVLMPQRHSQEDDLVHIRTLLPALTDHRYIRVDGKPVLLIYRSRRLPDVARTIECWRQEASRLAGIELMLCRVESFTDERGDPRTMGFDAAVEFQPDFRELAPLRRRSRLARGRFRVLEPLRKASPTTVDYGRMVDAMLTKAPVTYPRFPCVTPGWDNTPRRRARGLVITGSTPTTFERWCATVAQGRSPQGVPNDLLFVNAWNEWGEGNHLEPGVRWGHAFLDSHAKALAGRGGG